MAFGCCGKTFTCLFIFFNVIFAIVGLATVGFGIFLKVHPSTAKLLDLVELGQETSVYLANSAWIIIGFGALVLLVCFCGCVGAASKNKCMLGLYIIFSIIIVIGEIAAFVVTILFVVRSDDVDAFQGYIGKTLAKEYRPGRTKFTQPWDYVQATFECCAVSNYTDYAPVYVNNTMEKVPVTCCKLGGEKDPDDPMPVNRQACMIDSMRPDLTKSDNLHVRGCFQLLRETVKDYSVVLLIVEAVIIAITIIGIIIAACICRRGKEKV
ncbi:CD82 antigen-like [Haliotis rubra]|uniref:CD82 antigen-like n=1 Tax=Haliotis rubra TaxID=36100 RepID=UPI001EE5BDFB|nr:CD82 antigen-like [Haliotis rubra]XP_046552683.1 CD82 antigen-like [Haliotis rubra]